MRVALVYDRVNKWGGAERLLLALHEIWPPAPLFTSVYDPKSAPWASVFDVKTSFLQRFPLIKRRHEAMGWLMPLAFESLDLSDFEVVISLTSEAAKGVITSPRQIHICYLLTPTRYLWSHTGNYLDQFNFTIRQFAAMSFSNLRLWDYCAAQRPDYMITISDHVKKRCEKYYRRKAEVIRPPMMLGDSGGLKALKGSEGLEKLEGLKNYYLVVSRLVPYKKVDLAIEVCNRLRQPLVIVGEGTEKKKLKKMSGPTVKFAGNLTEGELVGYYRRARALLMPQEEDFGLAAVEAASLGVPVVSYKHSGVVETVRDGENGVWFEEQTAKSLIGAISRLEVYETSSRWKFRKQKFSPDRFKKEFKGKIKELWRQH